MFRKGTSPALFLLVIGFAMLTTSHSALAQYGGGGGGGGGIGGGRGGTSGAGRPSGVDQKDDLRGFHRALALQATAQQSELFTSAVQDAEGTQHRADLGRDRQLKPGGQAEQVGEHLGGRGSTGRQDARCERGSHETTSRGRRTALERAF